MSFPQTELSAFHEVGRVVFAYLNGYTCDGIELSETDAGRGGAKLNAGDDLALVQAILSGTPLSTSPDNKEKSIEVAKKLMTIYCAGSCVSAFFQNEKNIPTELDLEIPSHDLRNIELIQKFLSKALPEHSDNYPTQIMTVIFKGLKDADLITSIGMLSTALLRTENKSLNGFGIEDTLMASGLPIPKRTKRSPYNVDLQEDKTIPIKSDSDNNITFNADSNSPIDILLHDFLQRVRTNWKEEELNAAISYVKDIFSKYNR